MTNAGLHWRWLHERPQLIQCSNRHLRRSKLHAYTDRRVDHPERQLSRRPSGGLNVNQFDAIAAGPPIQRQPLSVQGMPAILDHDKPQSVCRITLDSATA